MFESVDILKRDFPETGKDLRRKITELQKKVSELSSENQFLKNQILEFALFPPKLTWVLYLCKYNETLDILNIEGDLKGIFGYTASQFDNKEVSIDELLCADMDSRYKMIKKNITEDNHYQIIYKIRQKSGRVKWVLDFGKIDETDQTKLDGCILDVAFQFSKEKNKELSQDIFKTVIDNIPINIFFKNKNSVYLACNKHFADRLGIKKEEITGKTDFELFPYNLALQYQNEDKDILKTGKPLETIDNYEKSRNNIYFQRLKYPIVDKRYKRTGIVGVSWDITSSRASGKILFKSPEHVKSILNQSADVIFIIGLYGNDHYVSPSIRNITAFTNKEVLKKKLSGLFTKNSFQKVKRLYKEYLRAARKSGGINTNPSKYLRSVELEMYHKNKGTIWIEVLANFLNNDKNEIIGIVGSIKDITVRKRMEQINSDNLIKEIKLNQLKSRFISTISHDLRTPLAVIKSNLSILKEQNYKLDKNIQNDAFEMCFDAISNISRNFEKIEVYKDSDSRLLDFQPSGISVKHFFRLLLKEINAVDKSDRVDLTVNFPEKSVMMDKHLMFHIFSNLIYNALKYSPKSSRVTITINDLKDVGVEVEIKDKGIGIPKKEIPLVFESFYRASNIGNVKGTGLGLSTVRNCVDIHKGTIHLTSTINKGTTIKVLLPYEHTRN